MPICPRETRPKPRHHFRRMIKVLLFLLVLGLGVRSVVHHANAATAHINAGITGLCLDNHQDSQRQGNPIDSWPCNNSAAQEWQLKVANLVQNGWCLSVAGDSTTVNSKVVLAHCNATPGEVWLSTNQTLENPNSGLCLAIPSGTSERQLVLASCQPSSPSQQWSMSSITTVDNLSDCNGFMKGEKLACTAINEWTRWHMSNVSHQTLLTQYTDGTPYEEWCADFISYVYKAAGYPFTGGETDGWNENNANNIQNMGFLQHDPSTYIPQPGDIAYFDYNGGHVEIVVSGGSHPTFIYGNSATPDPTTSNGEMAANTLTSDGAEGQLQYYLSPL